MATRPRWHWSLDWKSTVFVLVFLPLCVGLGFWQLERADQKRALLTRYEARQNSTPAPLHRVPVDDAAHRTVTLTGHFDSAHRFLLDNRIRRRRVGYEVLEPFRLAGEGGWVLVNRGWVPASRDRETLPSLPAVTGEQRLTGTVYVPSREPLLLGEAVAETGWPRRIQAVDTAALGDLLGRELWPHEVRLRADAPAALETGWPPVNTRVERHLGYAVQWFLMALALVLLFVFLNSNLWQVLTRNTGDTDR